MIFLGLDQVRKDEAVTKYCAEHGIKKAFVFSPARFKTSFSVPMMEHVEWSDIIRYVHYYRILEETGKDTLLVINECMRTRDRNDLTYNCLRNFINQTPHVLVFQYLPLIDTIEDFMILFDFVTRSRWKRCGFDRKLLKEARIHIKPVDVGFKELPVAVDERTMTAYAKERERLFDEVRGNPEKDAHVIPRNLHLIGGKVKASVVTGDRALVGRNNRFKMQKFETYRQVSSFGDRIVFEFCHDFSVFSDFLFAARPSAPIDVLVADTKADRWYFDRYRAWSERIRDAQAMLQQ